MINIYYTCPSVPAELIAACGLNPRRVAPCLDTDSRTEGMCSFTTAWIEYMEKKVACGETFAAVFSTSCDQMRRAYDLLKLRISSRCFLFNAPSTTTQQAFGYYVAELRRLETFLCSISGKTPDWKRINKPLSHQTSTAEHSETAVRMAITGGPVSEPVIQHIKSFLHTKGAALTLDAVENAVRPLVSHDPVFSRGDWLERTARTYFEIPVIWKRPNTAYFDWITDIVRRSNVKGVILFRQSFCDLWHSQGQELRRRLSLPMLEVDLDGKGTLSQAAMSRIEAFVETLG